MRWLPEPFQSKLLAQQLSKKQLFVAVNEADGIIISLRKVLIVDDQDELSKILAQDLRCAHAQRELIEYGFFDCTLEFFQEAHEHFMPSQQILYMHVGSAFTHHAHRGKRINEQLSLYAYEQLHEEVCRKMLVYNYTTIALIYGLVDGNEWRTIQLIRQFFPFVQSISIKLGLKPAEKVSFYAYKRIKPEFIISPEGELVPLPDKQCTLVRGCVVLYNLY